MTKIIELKNVNKWFDKFQALKDVSLEVNQQEKIVICGPSGSGKSTLIRCINRLEEHQDGQIIVDGNEISENTKDIEKIRAEVGMVFQQFNLFPHLSILDNCTLAPIWVKKLPKKQAEEIAMQNLERVQFFSAKGELIGDTNVIDLDQNVFVRSDVVIQENIDSNSNIVNEELTKDTSKKKKSVQNATTS